MTKKTQATKPDVLIDLESANTTPDTLIFTLSAYKFNRHDQREFDENSSENMAFTNMNTDCLHLHFNPIEQLMLGRTTDVGTMKNFWSKQSEEAKYEIFATADTDNHEVVNLKDGLEQFAEFISGSETIFARGTDFEGSILPDAFKTAGIKCPFKYNALRDVRTHVDALTGGSRGCVDIDVPDWFVAHHSLHDCIRDAAQIQEAEKLNVERIKSTLEPKK
ncbi:hypothetical protein A134_23215 [Vibrio crassostreae 9CS106]|uniref:3'-5' exoribonuclease Rv2179c-like domain-containing protein n=1 Tax=Vibrio crassostreae 9CS106 TaxID=1191300 RepID=A0A1B1C3F4_9VIBR|nr:hypothetical protein A134_23215 [Vibrio crassostreae 9CS106]